MFGLLLTAGLSAASVMAPSPASRTELALPSDYRWALLSGLEHRLGGKFVVIGLKGAQADCDVQQSCVTPAALNPNAQVDIGRVPVQSKSGVTIFGQSPVAFVSVIDVKRGREVMTIRLAVLDPVTRTVTQKLARVAWSTSGAPYGSKQLRTLTDLE